MNSKSKTFLLIAMAALAMLLGTIVLTTCKSPASPASTDSIKYTLTVSLGEGVTGTPSSGTHSYSKGEVVNYSYSLNSGYTNLVVKLDGQQVNASGTITMNSNHTLNATAEKTEGKWLEYWSGTQPSRFILSVQYYCVRFTRPSEWSNISIDKVKIVFASSGQNIKLSFWGNYLSQGGDYWPSGSPAQSAVLPISSGANEWDVSSYGWVTSQPEFFVGFEQVGSYATLTGDGKNSPENRSYRQYLGKSWEKELGMLANYCISVYVTKK